MKQHDLIIERRNWAREIFLKCSTYSECIDPPSSFMKSLKRVGAEIADESAEYFQYVFSSPDHHADFFHAVKINVYVPRHQVIRAIVFYSGYYGVIVPIPGTSRDSLFIPYVV